MKKLELKHWASYLSHKVKVKIPHTSMICELTGINFEDKYIEVDYPRKKNNCGGEIISFKDNTDRGHNSYIENCFILLHPLSDLTKPITVPGYNNGQEFVPIIELAKMNFNKKNIHILQHESVTEYADRFSINCRIDYPVSTTWQAFSISKNIESIPYWIVNLLFQWHFAIDIPEGTWIDINTIKK